MVNNQITSVEIKNRLRLDHPCIDYIDDAELDTMFEAYQAEQKQLEEDLGEYLPDYERAIRVLNARIQAYEEEERMSLYESFKKRNSMRQACLELRRAA